ncbi:hypothetical protein MQC88_04655 [Luteimonas sp. 50]|uniref:Uncharacterized protein n=1 Tax=Cognatiluteimonas sedimenti TaxID=2927791 RepID=A0ABT0A2Q1_9GAMM|nr:hypothetical protein [Lysobacter sedimenti]MCJ0825254.1 hypothetical protein [Lysobacter sedimenti]
MSRHTVQEQPPGNPPRPDAQDRSPDPDELVDLQGDQSFPASDPPSWTLGPDKEQGD